MNARQELGRRGEDAACDLFRRAGYAVERNYRCEHGEMDVIASRGSLLVFCEVKTRATDHFGLPAEAVGHAKQLRLRRIAAAWMAEHLPGRVEVRFDVVSVIVGPRGLEVTHLPGAF